MLPYALTTSSLAGRILTSVICMFSPRSPLPLGVCDFLQRPRLLNVPSEKGDNSAGTCDSDREPDDASQRPTESIVLPNGDQSEDDTGYAEEYNQPQTQSYYYEMVLYSPYLVLVGFDEPSICTFDCVLPGSWGCGISLSVAPGSCFMILLRGGGSLLEITNSPLGV